MTHPIRLIGLVPLVLACSESAFGTKMDAGSDTGMFADAASESYGFEDEAPSEDGESYAPEVEDELLALKPATTPRYVFVANPERNTVTRISVPGLAVITAEVGQNPTDVAVTQDHSTAVTFNMDSDDISIIDADTLEVQTVAIRSGRNRMVMSPDGKWVLCYFDQDADDRPTTGSGAQSFNDISLVNVETLEHFPMVVGPNPHGAHFSSDSSVAVVVSDSYLSRINLRVDEPEPEHIQITDDLVDPPLAEEVVVSPDGSAAIVRQFGATELVHVDLEGLDRTSLAVGDNPTDLDITPDGTELVVIARGSNELWVYGLSDPFAEQSVLELPPEAVFGSVTLSPDNRNGLLYSTASGESVYASWNRETNDVVLRDLVKPIKSVGVSPTGGTALIAHGLNNGTDVGSDSPYYNRPAVSLIDLDTFFGSAVALPGEPKEFAHTPDGEMGFFIMENQPYLEILNFDTLIHDEIELKSNPVHLGTLLDTQTAYVSQEHHLGRISFFHPEDFDLQTITGFELNANIEQ